MSNLVVPINVLGLYYGYDVMVIGIFLDIHTVCSGINVAML